MHWAWHPVVWNTPLASLSPSWFSFQLLTPLSLLTGGVAWEAEKSLLNVKAAEQQLKHQGDTNVRLKMLPSVTSHFFHTKLKDEIGGAKWILFWGRRFHEVEKNLKPQNGGSDPICIKGYEKGVYGLCECLTNLGWLGGSWKDAMLTESTLFTWPKSPQGTKHKTKTHHAFYQAQVTC